MENLPTIDTLAAQFVREAKRRKRDRVIRQSRLLSLMVIFLMIGASFIPDPTMRRLIGLPTFGLLLALKGFISYRQWHAQQIPVSDQNAY